MKAFLAGLGTGVVLGVVFAPERGGETRRRLLEQAEDLAETARQKAEKLVSRARENAGGISGGNVRSWAEIAREGADRLREKAGEWQREGEERLRDAAGELRRHGGDNVIELGQRLVRNAKGAVQEVASQTGAGLLVALNTASRERLMEVHGIGPVLAERVIEGRPYMSAEQVLERGILPESAYRELVREFRAA